MDKLLALLKELKLDALVAIAKQYFGPVPASIQAHLNVEELVRVAFTGLTTGGTFGAALSAVLANYTLFIPPADQALAYLVITVVSVGVAIYHEVLRRLGHGNPVAPPVGEQPAVRLFDPSPSPAA